MHFTFRIPAAFRTTVWRYAANTLRRPIHTQAHTRKSRSIPFPYLLPLPILFLALRPSSQSIECSPTFQGVPVAATFLMHQALPRFEKKFPGLELSAVYDMSRPEEYKYEEEGWFGSLMPSYAIVEVPIFEKLTQAEEAKLGGAGIRKKPVGKVQLKGTCSLGCAKVELMEMKVYKVNGDMVWEWKKKGS